MFPNQLYRCLSRIFKFIYSKCFILNRRQQG
jgi:hypothetical protein